MANVPDEPTELMLIYAANWSREKYGKPIGNDAAIGCYKAMLAAAPQPPAPNESTVPDRSQPEKSVVLETKIYCGGGIPAEFKDAVDPAPGDYAELRKRLRDAKCGKECVCGVLIDAGAALTAQQARIVALDAEFKKYVLLADSWRERAEKAESQLAEKWPEHEKRNAQETLAKDSAYIAKLESQLAGKTPSTSWVHNRRYADEQEAYNAMRHHAEAQEVQLAEAAEHVHSVDEENFHLSRLSDDVALAFKRCNELTDENAALKAQLAEARAKYRQERDGMLCNAIICTQTAYRGRLVCDVEALLDHYNTHKPDRAKLTEGGK